MSIWHYATAAPPRLAFSPALYTALARRILRVSPTDPDALLLLHTLTARSCALIEAAAASPPETPNADADLLALLVSFWLTLLLRTVGILYSALMTMSQY